jgi:hypothetical protein
MYQKVIILFLKAIPFHLQPLLIKSVQKIKNSFYLINSLKYTIVDQIDAGTIIECVNEKHIENVTFPPIYEMTVGAEVDFIMNDLNLMLYQNTLVFPFSDFLITEKGVVWNKFHKVQFTKNITYDFGLLKVKNNSIYVRKSKRIISIENGFSMCGVYSDVWPHFLVQYLPKLYLIEKILTNKNEQLIVILPNYSDPHIREIVYTYLKKFTHIDIIEVERNCTVKCNRLYYIESISDISDKAEYPFPSDIIIPGYVAKSLKQNFISVYNKLENIPDETYSKLYILRRGKRSLINYKEVEIFFKELGFKFIEPHKLTLADKVAIFSNAKIVVGPLSSGFTNLIFSKNDTKVLVLTNFVRSFEGYFGFILKYFVTKIIILTGSDKSGHPNCSYYISKEKVKIAYEELLK